MSIEFLIFSTIGGVIIWTIPITIVGLKMRHGKVPQKNFLIITKVFFWMSFALNAIAEIQYMAGLNQTLADPTLRAYWIAFLWPIGFASSFGGFFVTNDKKEYIRAAIKLFLSVMMLILQLTNLIG